MKTPAQALQLLASLGASPWLVRHHELVVEAAESLVRGIAQLEVACDQEKVLLGAALHDVGKIVHPAEMKEPGHRHEAAGEQLLVTHGVPTELARFCVTHASWQEADRTIEDLLVALADKLWKGKRVDDLERLVLERIARITGRESWEVFDELDAICEEIAADGESRLARSLG
jgi:putative nucleotidyltransferase with HDIG domain